MSLFVHQARHSFFMGLVQLETEVLPIGIGKTD